LKAQAAKKTPYRIRFQRVPTRARIGLAMRRDMNFGPLGDVEPMIQAGGLSIAPISTGDASLHVNGVTVLPTAKAGDLESGDLKALVVPGGHSDEAGDKAVRELVDMAMSKGLPVIAFGEGVVHATRAAGANPSDYVDAPAVVTDGDVVTMLADRDALSAATARIG
jgi:putative intracellular protease/amidase|tara:strand:+ start:6064 stop:6561 length:498 start_codon:yes stop_codon:yes gene_type:complete